MAISRSGHLYKALRHARNQFVIASKRLREVPATCSIHPSSRIAGDLEAGPYVFIGRRCTVGPGVRIGRYTMLASEVAVVGDDHNSTDPDVPMQFAGRPRQRRTEIGSDVWLGHGVTVLRGITIGDGAIVAAGSVVTRNIAPREVWAGVPARRVRARFADAADDQRHASMVAGPAVPATFAPRQRVRS